jgi:hypothetical protein
MCQEKQEQVVDGSLWIDILPDKLMHAITQQKRTNKKNKNGQLIQKINY